MSVLSNSPEASIEPMMLYIGRRAREAAHTLALASTEAKNEALERMAARIELSSGKIIEANRQDLEAAQSKGRDAAFLDRLRLDGLRVAAMARGLREVAALADPVGKVMARWTRPNGLEISRVRVPLGVMVETLETATTWSGLQELHTAVASAIAQSIARRAWSFCVDTV